MSELSEDGAEALRALSTDMFHVDAGPVDYQLTGSCPEDCANPHSDAYVTWFDRASNFQEWEGCLGCAALLLVRLRREAATSYVGVEIAR